MLLMKKAELEQQVLDELKLFVVTGSGGKTSNAKIRNFAYLKT